MRRYFCGHHLIKFTPKVDVHRIYDKHVFIDDLLASSDVTVIRSLTSRYRLTILGTVVSQKFVWLTDLIYLPKRIANISRNRHIVLREFWIPHLILIAVLFPMRKNIFFNINHEINKITRNKFTSVFLKIILLKKKFLWLEGSKALLPNIVQSMVLTPKFSVSDLNSNKLTNEHLHIGVVGLIRQEKNVHSLISELYHIRKKLIQKNIYVHIGMPKEDMAVFKKKFGDFTFIDTTQDSAYQNFLMISDIIILDYEEEQYEFRHSGVLIDAISHRCVPIVNDLPLFRTLTSYPVRIGIQREKCMSIEAAIDFATVIARDPFARQNWIKYFQKRSPASENLIYVE